MPTLRMSFDVPLEQPPRAPNPKPRRPRKPRAPRKPRSPIWRRRALRLLRTPALFNEREVAFLTNIATNFTRISDRQAAYLGDLWARGPLRPRFQMP